MEREALSLAMDGLERILGSFEKDGKFVRSSMIRNELFNEIHLLLVQAKKALAQPAQEPVAIVNVRPLMGHESIPQTIIKWKNGRPVAGPLYTAPPQRTWVGLTDEQQEEMYQMTDNIADCRTCYFQGIADAEAAHNIGAAP